jgi:phosphoribosylamine---glycine ligase
VTSGGRVLTVCAKGSTFADAQRNAYGALEKIHFAGTLFRRDIGSRAISRD